MSEHDFRIRHETVQHAELVGETYVFPFSGREGRVVGVPRMYAESDIIVEIPLKPNEPRVSNGQVVMRDGQRYERVLVAYRRVRDQVVERRLAAGLEVQAPPEPVKIERPALTDAIDLAALDALDERDYPNEPGLRGRPRKHNKILPAVSSESAHQRMLRQRREAAEALRETAPAAEVTALSDAIGDDGAPALEEMSGPTDAEIWGAERDGAAADRAAIEALEQAVEDVGRQTNFEYWLHEARSLEFLAFAFAADVEEAAPAPKPKQTRTRRAKLYEFMEFELGVPKQQGEKASKFVALDVEAPGAATREGRTR